MVLPLIIMFHSDGAGKVNFTGLLREQDVKLSQGNIMMQRTRVKFVICRNKISSIHLGLNQTHWVSLGDREGHPTARVQGLVVMDGRVYVQVWVEELTHTRCTSLSWLWEYVCVGQVHQDPSINGAKYALRHCWHGVNNLTLTEMGEACSRMETETEREMDWTVIDIQFELLQIFPFSRKLSTLWSIYAAGQLRVIFPAFDQNYTLTVSNPRENSKEQKWKQAAVYLLMTLFLLQSTTLGLKLASLATRDELC